MVMLGFQLGVGETSIKVFGRSYLVYPNPQTLPNVPIVRIKRVVRPMT